jgi:SAM-dependent methyltransferase
VETVLPLRGRSVLEYGCGNGAVTAAFAPATARYTALDIDESAIAAARRILAEGRLHPTFVAASPEGMLDEVRRQRGEIDVFLCYAVLEHMSLDERLALLRAARDVVRPEGIIVIVETPNRLTPWDYHTSQLPFLNQLPEDLALRYLDRSPRPEFRDALRTAAANGPEALREAFNRWGRGMSFHELELVFDDLPRHVAGSSWEPVLLPERDIHREELALQRVLDRARPELPPSFSRYWLDVILTAEPQPEGRRFLRPWALRTSGSVDAYYDFNEVIHLPSPESMLAVVLPCPTTRLVVVAEGAQDGLAVDVFQPATGRRRRQPTTDTGNGGVADIRLSEPCDHYEVHLSQPGWVTLVAYEA